MHLSYHGHGFGRQHLVRRQGGEVSQVCQHVNQSDYRQRDDDSQRQVSRKKIEIVMERCRWQGSEAWAAALWRPLKAGMSRSARLRLFSVAGSPATCCSPRRGEDAHTGAAWRLTDGELRDNGQRDFLRGETLAVWASNNPRSPQRQLIKNTPPPRPCLLLAGGISPCILFWAKEKHLCWWVS